MIRPKHGSFSFNPYVFKSDSDSLTPGVNTLECYQHPPLLGGVKPLESGGQTFLELGGQLEWNIHAHVRYARPRHIYQPLAAIKNEKTENHIIDVPFPLDKSSIAEPCDEYLI